MKIRNPTHWIIPVGLALTVAVMLFARVVSQARTDVAGYQRVQPLLRAGKTVVDEQIRYPDSGSPAISSVIVTMLPGEATGWHTHGVPLFAFMLEGEIEVDYGAKGIRTYKKGDAFLEAMAIRHNGKNKGVIPARVLAVFVGAEGTKNVVHEKTPPPAR